MTEAEKLAQDLTHYRCAFAVEGARVDPRYVHFSQGVYWVTCPACFGTGHRLGPGRPVCLVCAGARRLTAQPSQPHAPAAGHD